MKFTTELPAEILDKSLRAKHAPNIVIDPNEVFKLDKEKNYYGLKSHKEYIDK